uniref:magnesium chelatase subunit ChlI family protein n=1 Tax=Rhizobium sp. F40D2 TaxID=3453141 RepID=UPI003F2167C7
MLHRHDRKTRRTRRRRPAALARRRRKMKFSARGYHRVLKVARTLADLDGKPTVGRLHLAEAISYRIAGERLTAAA